MSKAEAVKEKITTLRDEMRNVFLLFMAIITGSTTVFYQVLVKSIPIYFIFLAISGYVSSIFIVSVIRQVRLKIDKLTDELEEL